MAVDYGSDGNYDLQGEDPYSNEGNNYTGDNALDPVTNSPVNSGGNWWDPIVSGIGSLFGGSTSGGGGGAGNNLGWLGLAALLNQTGAGGTSQPPPSGYQGGVPQYTAGRQQYAFSPTRNEVMSPAPNDEAIRAYLTQPGLTDTGIASMMARYGVDPARMAAATGMPEADIEARRRAAYGPNEINPGVRRPGQGGITYFSPMQYTATGQDMGAPQAGDVYGGGIASMLSGAPGAGGGGSTTTQPPVVTTGESLTDAGGPGGSVGADGTSSGTTGKKWSTDANTTPTFGGNGSGKAFPAGLGAGTSVAPAERNLSAEEFAALVKSLEPPAAPASTEPAARRKPSYRGGYEARNYTGDDINTWARQNGWLDAAGQPTETGRERIYQDAQQSGATYAQLDNAFGWPAGTTQSWVQSKGYAPLRTVNTSDPEDPSYIAGTRKGYAEGGLASLPSRAIRGPGTGTSDSIPALIDGKQPAALSTGEFVVDALTTKKVGTKALYEMMDKAHNRRKQAQRA